MYEAWAYTRVQAMEILDHINKRYALHMERREISFRILIQGYLSHQLRYLVSQAKGKTRAINGHISSSGQLIKTIAAAFSAVDWLPDSLETHQRLRRPADKYDWYDKSEYLVFPRREDRTIPGGFILPFP
jgi:hypothetical protein